MAVFLQLLTVVITATSDVGCIGVVDVRLAAPFEFRGRAEVNVDGQWGGVCGDSYQDHEASVFCRQRNCDGGRAIVDHPTNSSTVVFYSFICEGTERRLNDCNYNGSRSSTECSEYYSPDTECFPATTEPQLIQITELGTRSFRLSWHQPVLSTCQLVHGYRVHCRGSDSVSVEYQNVNLGEDVRMVIVEPLVPYTQYNCCVAAFNNNGGQEKTTCFRTRRTLPVPPTAPQQVTVSDLLSTGALVAWQPPQYTNGSILHYTVRCSRTLANHEVSSNSITPQLFMSGLLPYSSYNCCVTATNSAGTGSAGCAAVFWTDEAAPICPPQDVKIRPLNATALIITWGPPPPYAVNGIIVAYTLRFTKVETREMERVERSGQHTVLVVSSLHPFYHYGVSMSSNTSAGEGPFSDPVLTRLPQNVPTAPPQNVSLTKVSALSVTLTWEPPATEHQNGLITGYIVTIYRGSEQEQRKETADNSTTIDSLSGNTHYKLYLAARTDIGIGPNSDAVDFKTKIYALEAGVYGAMTFSIAGVLFPSLVVLVLVIGCYEVEKPCCCCCCSIKRHTKSDMEKVSDTDLKQMDPATPSLTEGTVPDKESGIDPQYEELKSEKQEEVNVYEKLQDASRAKTAHSEYQELKTQEIAQLNPYDTINHGSTHPTSEKLQRAEERNAEYKHNASGVAKASPDSNYQELQKKGIDKPSVYETIGPGIKASKNTKSEDVSPTRTTDTEQALHEEFPPFQGNSTSDEVTGVPYSGGAEQRSSDFEGVAITCTASAGDNTLETADTSLPSNDELESNAKKHVLYEPTEVKSKEEP